MVNTFHVSIEIRIVDKNLSMEIVHEMSYGLFRIERQREQRIPGAQNRSLLPIGGSSNDEIVRISAIFVRLFHFTRIFLEIIQSKEHASPPNVLGVFAVRKRYQQHEVIHHRHVIRETGRRGFAAIDSAADKI